MDFLYHLTNNPHKVFIYNSPGTTICQLPKGISMVYILAIGAGGGGGGGFTRTASPAQAGGGGGGGGTGGVNRAMIPKILLTDSLVVSVGTGGDGGGAGVSGTAGTPSNVGVNDGTVSLGAQAILVAATTGGGGGNPGTAVAGGTGGSAGGASSATINAKAALGEFVGRAGIAGGDGNATGSPLAGIYGTGVVPLSAGRGGAGINAANPGTSANGGSISGRGFVQDVAGGVAPGGNGQNGMFMMKPFVSLGGTGGASHNASDGGNGGNGGPGSGGGGGGAGTSPRPGGTGGRGGNGLVIIVCW